MRPLEFISRSCVKVFAVALLGVAGLAGCNSNSDDGDNVVAVPAPAPTPAPAPVPAIDAFYAAVAALAASSPDDTESGGIDTAAMTTPEDSEPQPLG